jgi:hypothetical protein
MIALEKPITRETRRNLMHYKHPLVVTLLPGTCCLCVSIDANELWRSRSAILGVGLGLVGLVMFTFA